MSEMGIVMCSSRYPEPPGRPGQLGGRALKAWECLRKEPEVVMPNNRKVHVQSIAKSWGRERLAEDIVNLKNQIHEASDREQKLQVCKRRLEAEVQALQSNLNKAEEILHKKTCTSSPNKMLTCFNQSPEQTSLVRSLKIQNRELTQTRNELEAELIKLRKSARMTRINELESQNLISQDEINHQKAISEFLFHRLREAEKATDAAADIAARVARDMDTCNADIPSSKKGLDKTMEVLQNAHQVLIQQANALKARLPIGSTFEQLEGLKGSIGRPTKAPVQILKYLRAHLSRMESTLLGLPGGQTDFDKKEGRPKSKSQQSARQPKRKSNIAKTIEMQIGEVLTCLEKGGMSKGASAQIENLMDVLENLRLQIARVVSVKSKEAPDDAQPGITPPQKEPLEEEYCSLSSHSKCDVVNPLDKNPVIVIPTVLAAHKSNSLHKRTLGSPRCHEKYVIDNSKEEAAEQREQIDVCEDLCSCAQVAGSNSAKLNTSQCEEEKVHCKRNDMENTTAQYSSKSKEDSEVPNLNKAESIQRKESKDKDNTEHYSMPSSAADGVLFLDQEENIQLKNKMTEDKIEQLLNNSSEVGQEQCLDEDDELHYKNEVTQKHTKQHSTTFKAESEVPCEPGASALMNSVVANQLEDVNMCTNEVIEEALPMETDDSRRSYGGSSQGMAIACPDQSICAPVEDDEDDLVVYDEEFEECIIPTEDCNSANAEDISDKSPEAELLICEAEHPPGTNDWIDPTPSFDGKQQSGIEPTYPPDSEAWGEIEKFPSDSDAVENDILEANMLGKQESRREAAQGGLLPSSDPGFVVVTSEIVVDVPTVIEEEMEEKTAAELPRSHLSEGSAFEKPTEDNSSDVKNSSDIVDELLENAQVDFDDEWYENDDFEPEVDKLEDKCLGEEIGQGRSIAYSPEINDRTKPGREIFLPPVEEVLSPHPSSRDGLVSDCLFGDSQDVCERAWNQSRNNSCTSSQAINELLAKLEREMSIESKNGRESEE